MITQTARLAGFILFLFTALSFWGGTAHTQTSKPPSAGKPSILIIWGDDVGM
jgi:hypothetical protein